MKKTEREEFEKLIEELSMDERTQEMEKYIQHGTVTTYDHCMQVARTSYWLNDVFHIKSRKRELVRGAFLHDYYLYDWHLPHENHRNLHGFYHPGIAARNAKRDFTLSKKEENIIESHMWPLTVTKLPKSREAILVGIADKICSARETLVRWERK